MRVDGPYRICFVCSGNICRSPMAEVVLRRMVADAGLAERIVVDSAGTGDWHIGEHADRRALDALTRAGYGKVEHRARQFEPGWFADRDLVVALDRGHLRTLRSWAPSEPDREKVHLLRTFDPNGSGPGAGELDVPDPYYDGPGRFDSVLDLIEESARGLLDHVRASWAAPDSRP